MSSILAARSSFSIGESILTTERLIKEAKKVNATVVALTDDMSITGLVDFTRNAKKEGIKPIIGCRLRLVDDPSWRKAKKGEEKSATPPEFYLTWYVLSENGLKALYRLLTIAYSEDRFYFDAKLGFDDLYAALEDVTSDDVIIASSDVYSVLHHDSASDILARCSGALSRSNVFLTLSPIDTPLYDTLNARAINLGKTLGLGFLVSRPVFYGRDEGEDVAHEVMGAISSNVTVDKPWHRSIHNRDFFPRTKEEFLEDIKAAVVRLINRGLPSEEVKSAFIDGIRRANTIDARVKYEWAKQAPSLPKMATDEFTTVVEECKKGWAERFKSEIFGHKPSEEELKNVYRPRLLYELEVLKKLNFSGYFLLVQDVVRFAKSSGILVGPGRGSVGGSLVAYLMGITDCDPLRFNLLFERFINPDRSS
jgi:DNA polymerase-3 subunit alpha